MTWIYTDNPTGLLAEDLAVGDKVRVISRNRIDGAPAPVGEVGTVKAVHARQVEVNFPSESHPIVCSNGDYLDLLEVVVDAEVIEEPVPAPNEVCVVLGLTEEANDAIKAAEHEFGGDWPKALGKVAAEARHYRVIQARILGALEKLRVGDDRDVAGELRRIADDLVA